MTNEANETALPTDAKRYTNLHSWRRDAVQLITVRPGERAGSVRATFHATIASTMWATALRHDLIRATPTTGRVYMIGTNDKGVVTSTGDAMELAINDFLNGGTNGDPGELGMLKS